MAEQWMEDTASTDGEVAKARERFRTELARADQLSRDLEDPTKAEMLANTPPHLVGRK